MPFQGILHLLGNTAHFAGELFLEKMHFQGDLHLSNRYTDSEVYTLEEGIVEKIEKHTPCVAEIVHLLHMLQKNMFLPHCPSKEIDTCLELVL